MFSPKYDPSDAREIIQLAFQVGCGGWHVFTLFQYAYQCVEVESSIGDTSAQVYEGPCFRFNETVYCSIDVIS